VATVGVWLLGNGPRRKTPEDTVTARPILLDGMARDAVISGLVTELAPLHPRNDTFPARSSLRLASDALDWCGASRERPLTLEAPDGRLASSTIMWLDEANKTAGFEPLESCPG
jgi:hypothetical protein